MEDGDTEDERIEVSNDEPCWRRRPWRRLSVDSVNQLCRWSATRPVVKIPIPCRIPVQQTRRCELFFVGRGVVFKLNTSDAN